MHLYKPGKTRLSQFNIMREFRREDAMSPDIEKALAYQVKKEIAQRYFGIRKLIDEDSANVKAMIKDLNQFLEKKIAPAILRIYMLLMDSDLIDEFLNIIGWEGRPFIDANVAASADARKKLLQGIHTHGWLKSSRFANLLLKSYEDLYDVYLEFDDLREDILDELAIVEEEITQFKRNYSLDEIMSFLRGLNFDDEATVKALGKNIDSSKMGELEKKLGFPDIQSIRAEMPDVPKLPKPEAIEDQLRDLASRVYNRHKDEIQELLEVVR